VERLRLRFSSSLISCHSFFSLLNVCARTWDLAAGY
jgi:hypothetical protein